MKPRLIPAALSLLFLLGCFPSFAQIEIGGENPPPEKKEHTLKFFNKTELGVSFGIGSFKTDVYNGIQKKIRNDELVATFQTINGVSYLNRLAIGVSLGVEKWQNGLFWPVYGYIGYDFRQADNTFYAAVYLGYGFGHRDATTYYEAGDGAFAMSIGLGYKMKLTSKLRFVYEVFYKYQAIDSKYNVHITGSQGQDTIVSRPDYKIGLHFLGFKIGLNFP